jgi:hypothetical protein
MADATTRLTDHFKTLEEKRAETRRKALKHLRNAQVQLDKLTESYVTGSHEEINCWDIATKTSRLIQQMCEFEDSLKG